MHIEFYTTHLMNDLSIDVDNIVERIRLNELIELIIIDMRASQDLAINNYQSYSEGKRWLIWLNNVLQTEAANHVRLKSGDIVEFKYINLVN